MPKIIQEGGCNWRSCLGIAETFLGKEFNHEQLLRLADRAVGLNFMDEHCVVSNPGKIIRLGLEMLDGEWSAYDVATSSAPNWTIDWYGWVRNAKKFSIMASTLRGLTKRGHEHWREGDAGGHLLWDPHSDAPIDHELQRVYFMIEER
jgi:hypothetical protein